MKKTIYLLATIVSLLFCSCNNDEELSKLIIGKYYYTEYVEDIDWDEEVPIAVTSDVYEEFHRNNTVVESGNISFLFYSESGKNIKVEYSYTLRGKWKIKNSFLYYDYMDIGNFRLNFEKSNANSYIEREEVNYVREFVENDFLYIMKETLLDCTTKIIKINDSNLVTEYDNERFIQKRIQ